MHSEEFGPNIESLVLGLGIANGHDVYAVVSLVYIYATFATARTDSNILPIFVRRWEYPKSSNKGGGCSVESKYVWLWVISVIVRV